MRARRLLVAGAGALACVLPATASGTASASASASPDARMSTAVRWPDRRIVVGLPAKRVLGDGDVTIRENGVSVGGVRVTSEAQDRGRGVMLVIDTSLTMRGEPIRQAMAAARAFARHRAAHTPLGVVYFSGTPRVALAPTTDARKIAAELAVGPQISRGTRIYDAAAAGISAMRARRLTSGVVVVLSDGAEAIRGSAISAPRLTAAARGADVRIFSVGLASRSFDSAALRVMASGTGGRYGQAAHPRDLPPIFAAIGERLSKEYLVSYRSPMPAGRSVAVRVAVAGEGAPARLGYRAPSLSFAGAAPGRAEHASALSPTRVGLLAAAVFAALTAALYLALRPRRRSVVSRVEDFAGPSVAPQVEAAVQPGGDEPAPSRRWQRYAEAVELADLRVSARDLALGTAAATFVVAWYLGVTTGRAPLAVLALAVPMAVRVVVRRRIATRRHAFEEQLPDNLQVMASALRAGYSFSAALAAMAEDASEPSRTELRRAAADEQLGMDVAESLRAVGERMASAEIEYVGIVARMQRESGGNTAEVLEHVTATIRERLKLRRMVRVLTAQGRMGGAIVTAIPVVLALAMAAMHPGYFDPMLESPTGVLLFIAGVLLIGAGWLSINKIVDVEP